jgi:dihydrodipicolinate synthase/N-acetylneuraminate lyase
VAAGFPELVSALVAEPTPERLAPVQALRSALSRHTFQASVKAALGWRGLPVRPDVRAPLLPLATVSAEQLRTDLEPLLGSVAASRQSRAALTP